MASFPKADLSSEALNATDDSANSCLNSSESHSKKSRINPTVSTSSLGFGNIPAQLHRKAVKKGFNFTIMVIGESGLGKSTFINCLMAADLYKDREPLNVIDNVSTTTKIVKRFIELDEKGVKLRVTIIDTPGFADPLNAEYSCVPIEDYINDAYEHYFKEECGLNRKNIQDNRVHCCLYFVSPFGRGLRPVDVSTIRRLQHKVNIVPVIAKADSLTAPELTAMKQKVMADVDRHQLEVYRLPECDSDEDSTIRRLDEDIKSCLPFAVIGSADLVDGGSVARCRGRSYAWGNSEVDNTKHCDFARLRVFLLKTHMQDLKDMTSDILYENYRAKSITDRMCRRQNERHSNNTDDSSTPQTPGKGYDGHGRPSKQAATEMCEPGFEMIVDPENLLLHKEEEIKRMRVLCEKLQDDLQASGQCS